MRNIFNIPKTFFGFLLASILFWLLINLSKEYTVEIAIDTVYTNLSIEKTIIETPIKKIPLLIKGSGFKLISTSFSNDQVVLNLEKANRKKDVDYYFYAEKLQSEVQSQLKSGIELISIQKDTIPLKIGTLHSKEVPLITNLDINFKLGHDLSSPVIVKPNTVLISGEESLLKNISFLELEPINLDNVAKNIKINASINTPPNIKPNITSAEISVFVDKFTEGEIEIPVSIKNAPKEINIFPKKVKIIYKVGLKNFNKVDANLFKIECDYNQVKNNQATYLTPKLTELPDSISVVRIVPKKIDFLIHN
ncbi:YbbR-like domain-containing protein [Tenacibaculum sp. AHE15PA]|uniref:CdaR family protein n=1 Tax=unclassified Tenacibaculum TaxID=2635139 RepID=UPI001C4ED0E4|nr:MULTISPECIES: YbbR-like domain-containing protein [unclassified Tenacibaculum]QXP74335.1 YbbR-like domain-containing protein [Tenacibaculum sp. AHE14PA]QXP75295.1 YbbR-like domain-containing protein [Tenacibaculum sp. AHE15PA]